LNRQSRTMRSMRLGQRPPASGEKISTSRIKRRGRFHSVLRRLGMSIMPSRK
jgi:hypothetical protein